MGSIVYAGQHDRKRPHDHSEDQCYEQRRQAIPPSDAKLMVDQIPNVLLAIIPGAAHLANLEQPDTFNKIVAAFTSELVKGKQN